MKKLVKARLVAVNGNKVLVLKKRTPVIQYTLPGGTKRKKETEVQTLIRETQEEIGLSLSGNQVHYYFALSKRSEFEMVDRHYFYTQLEPMLLEVREEHKFEQLLWLHWSWALNFMDKSDRQAVRVLFKQFGERFAKPRSLGPLENYPKVFPNITDQDKASEG